MIDVRIANAEDIPQISLVLATSWKTAYRGIVDDSYLDALTTDHWVDFLTKGLSGDDIFSMVMLEHHEIIGASVISKSDIKCEAHMVSLYLLPDRIGKGYGHRFYCEIEGELKKKGYSRCVLDVLENNKKAISFYQSHGFVDVGTEATTFLGEREYPYRVMVKDLAVGFQNIKPRITEPEVGIIISYAALDGSPEGVAKEAELYLSSDMLNFYGWVENGEVIGICGFEVHSDKVEIHLISVFEDRQKQGVGSAMVAALQKMYSLPLEAETVEEAVGFYRKRGFETTAFQDPEWGQKFTCILKVNPIPLGIPPLGGSADAFINPGF